jgi:hypothetical protein
MSTYKHTQIGYLMLAVLLVVAVFYAWLLSIIQAEGQLNGFVAAVIGIVIFILASFLKLTVTIDEQCVHLKFGYGIFCKSFPLADIASVKQVRNHWYYGWGIRLWLWPYMWIYNVSGFGAVEIVMMNGKIYRIGTDIPRELERAIRQSKSHKSKKKKELGVNRIEVTNFPKQKNVFAGIALIISLVSLVFVVYNYVFLERALIGIEDFNIKPILNSEGQPSSLSMNYKVTNFGKSTARDVEFNVYFISIDDDSIAQKQRHDGIINKIFPGTGYTFGREEVGLAYVGKNIALVFDFEYKDTLLGEQKSQLWFKNTIGSSNISYLLRSEQEKINAKYKSLIK